MVKKMTRRAEKKNSKRDTLKYRLDRQINRQIERWINRKINRYIKRQLDGLPECKDNRSKDLQSADKLLEKVFCPFYNNFLAKTFTSTYTIICLRRRGKMQWKH